MIKCPPPVLEIGHVYTKIMVAWNEAILHTPMVILTPLVSLMLTSAPFLMRYCTVYL